MPLATYNSLSKYFHLTQDVHLQGWGEPLLHPGLFDMIQSAKRENCYVSLTTNGALLTGEVSLKLISEGVDIVAISIAGATKETHESIRCGSLFDKLLKNIQTLTELKGKRQTKKPKLTLSFLMTKTNIKELSEAVEIAKAVGIDEMVATNLDYTPTPLQDELRVFSCKHANPKYLDYLELARKRAAAIKLLFRVYPLEIEEVVMCELNPLQIVYFSHNGYSSPCVYLNLSKQGSIPRIFCGTNEVIQKVTLGNIAKNKFPEIWSSADYYHFRRAYSRRLKVLRKCDSYLSVESMNSGQLQAFEKELEKGLSENPVPPPCKTCYKAYGI